jgi:hypothetical protein
MKFAILKPIDIQTESVIDPDRFEIVESINDLVNISAKRYIVFNTVNDSDSKYNVKRTIEIAREALSVTSAQIHILVCEMHSPEIIDLLTQLDRHRIHLHLSGQLNFSLKKAKVYCWPWWFSQTAITYFWHTPDDVKNQLDPYSVKEKVFDCLLGQQRVNRDFVYNGFVNARLADKSIMTYFGCHANALDDFIFEPHMEIPTFFDHSMTKVKYFNETLMVSSITPISVYNKSAYSIITETNAHNTFSFFTEKTAKPILGRRLFIVFNGQYFLRNLRQLGFKTFDGIIDESYDNEPDDQKRWQMALDVASWLSKQNQSEIFQNIKPITEHNFQLINTNWNQILNDVIQNS